MMRFSGRMRLYFNRHGAAPLVWCVATDDFELAVKSLVIEGVQVTSVYRVKATADDEDGKPSAWFEVDGVLTVASGNATIALAGRRVNTEPLNCSKCNEHCNSECRCGNTHHHCGCECHLRQEDWALGGRRFHVEEKVTSTYGIAGPPRWPR